MKAMYNTELDILTVEKEEYHSFDRSLELGGIVLDLDTEGGFLGIEIIDAAQTLPLTQEQLSRIQEAGVTLETGEDYLRVQIELTIDGQKNVISSQYPTPATA